MSAMPPGTTVKHRLMGRGTILQSRYHGYEYWVQFRAVRAWVKGTELQFQRGATRRASSGSSRRLEVDSPQAVIARTRAALGPEPDTRAPKLPPATHEDRCVLEAFRLGTVPDRYVEKWTFGRDDELSHIRYWLDDEADGSLLLEGAYGSGKSHLLQAVRTRAEESQYAVSYSHLDAGEESAAFPKRLYRQVVRGLVVPQVGGLRHLLMAVVERHGGNPLPDHPILGPVLERIVDGTITETDWDAIAGEGTASAATGFLPDFTTSANVYCSLLGSLAWLCTHVLGLRGMLVLVDEVETASACLYRFHWRRAQSFFRGLTLTANDDPDLLDEAVIRERDAYRGEKSGLIYAGHRRIPYLHRSPCGLKIVLATTPGPMRGQYAEWRGEQTVVEIEPVRARALRQLAERINQVYGSLHGTSFKPVTVTALVGKLLQRFGGQATRRFIKAFVECLDFRRFNPDTPLKDIL